MKTQLILLLLLLSLFDLSAPAATAAAGGGKASVYNRLSAFRQMKTMRQAGGVWRSVGPDRVGGRINAIAIHPQRPNTIYIATAGGGVWKTTDEGRSWTPLTDFNLPVMSFGALTVDPVSPDTLYGGTGEPNFRVPEFGANSFDGRGAFKSADGGATWEPLGDLDTPAISRIVVDPANPQRMFVCGSLAGRGSNAEKLGVFVSTDGGRTFQNTLPNVSVSDLDIAASGSTLTVFAAAGDPYGHAQSGIYVSKSGGAPGSWQRIDQLPHGATIGRTTVAVAPRKPSVVYASFMDAPFGGLQSTHKSVDGGATWTQLPTFDYCTFHCWNDMFLRVDPADPKGNIVFAGGVDVWRSKDGGSSWKNLTKSYSNRPKTHPDQHALAFAPVAGKKSAKVYVGNDGGFFVTADTGKTFAVRNNGLAITQFQTLARDWATPEGLIAGAQDNGTRQTETGAPASWQFIFGGDGSYCAVNSQNPDTFYVSYQYLNLFRTEDRGQTFQRVRSGAVAGSERDTRVYTREEIARETTEERLAEAFEGAARRGANSSRIGFYAPFVLDPRDPDVLFAGTEQVLRTINHGAMLLPISGDLTAGGVISAITVAPSRSSTLWVGSSDGEIHVSTDARFPEPHFTRVRDERMGRGPVASIAVASNDPKKAVAVFSKYGDGHVWLTQDSGATWVNIDSNLPDIPVSAVLFDNRDESQQTIVIGTDLGVFISTNLGATWLVLGEGLPAVAVMALVQDESTRIWAATHGRSIFRLE